ncbi:bifunctional hydroxymethylpyrimidine kinase/phosphomethylpyrimidine kinase [Corynebacterium felinum]|uniref:Hydroxymethylpyrimidine kinase/phosphomethylpyrimidine kinase n=1 Tax=Corynebacterium felinum TaxID=131318 RepID=A0ABU2BAF5_9CORY|nr:bifunctional hydroxymethylpyrimidine kinase/phosphomethylpyrimidine kinase [Corynebacterium felinum]MDF5819483.1 bifunctional hydroxymethylpyrimidine kinase/phosphomethylpyrimidine kinase [Corynebacterium felinum]MDR7355614.1 hydroxymethylpyrimidine kinase/phosphomethylpyrimidine kinase [Corynebacterium felinum]WJY94966.1 Hydroxymethylpyrimidine/phosphomethylpyrimidine kinase [Corynebacterium felinum]
MSCARVLAIAGTDPVAGAGLFADLKSISAAGGYGLGAVTALVAQNSSGVRAQHIPDARFLLQQLEAVSDEVPLDAVKIGMVGSLENFTVLRNWLHTLPNIPLVVDPVMVSTSGHRLLPENAIDSLLALITHATVLTPNIPELALLSDSDPATTLDHAIDQAQVFASSRGVNVVVKTGHLEGSEAGNAWVSPSGHVDVVLSERVSTRNSRGTGCSLSSALATRLGGGEDFSVALRWCTTWMTEALRGADSFNGGRSNGPIDHFAHVRPFLPGSA